MIDITVYSKEVQAMLTELSAKLSPVGMAAFLGTRVGPYIQTRARDRFFDEGDDASGPWAPLSQVTQSIRESGEWSVGSAHPINKRTGELEDYVTGSAARFWPTTLGATVRYPGAPSGKKAIREKMKTAQKGKAFPKTPPRPVLGFAEEDLIFVQTQLAFFLSSGPGVKSL